METFNSLHINDAVRCHSAKYSMNLKVQIYVHMINIDFICIYVHAKLLVCISNASLAEIFPKSMGT